MEDLTENFHQEYKSIICIEKKFKTEYINICIESMIEKDIIKNIIKEYQGIDCDELKNVFAIDAKDAKDKEDKKSISNRSDEDNKIKEISNQLILTNDRIEKIERLYCELYNNREYIYDFWDSKEIEYISGKLKDFQNEFQIWQSAFDKCFWIIHILECRPYILNENDSRVNVLLNIQKCKNFLLKIKLSELKKLRPIIEEILFNKSKITELMQEEEELLIKKFEEKKIEEKKTTFFSALHKYIREYI